MIIKHKTRVIDTGLKTALDADIIDAVLGQLSDGKWEDSPKMEAYWPYIDVEKRGNKVVLIIYDNYSYNHAHPLNKFKDMSDDKVKFWIACRIKDVIKDEGLTWKRDNDEETEYLSTDGRSSKKSATVADCYYVYEVLKGRKVIKHPEYMSKFDEAKKILIRNGYKLIKE